MSRVMAFRAAGTEGSHGTRGFNAKVAQSARVYDYWLGGKDNFEADRIAGDAAIDAHPAIRNSARASREFLIRTVSYLAGAQGIRQFLDIGAGLPTACNTHQVAQSIALESRIVYVGNDPMVLSHARVLLTSNPQGVTAYLDADLRDTATILTQAAEVLDFTQPVAIMLLAILDHIPDLDEARQTLARLPAAVPPGSFLVISHTASDIHPGQTAEMIRRLNEHLAEASYVARPRDVVTRFFDGLDLVGPGVVRQQPGQPGRVGAGVEDHQDRRVAVPPVPGDQPGDDVADLAGGHLGLVVVRAEPHCIQHRGPAGAARLQGSDHRVRPARDHLRLTLAPAVDVAALAAEGVLAADETPVNVAGKTPVPEPEPGDAGEADPEENSGKKETAGSPHVLIVTTPDARLRLMLALASRRKGSVGGGIPAGFTGNLMTGGYTGYQHLLDRIAGIQQCCQHVIRRARQVLKLGPGSLQDRAGDIITVLRDAHAAVGDARARGSTSLDQQVLDDLRGRYDTAAGFGRVHNRLRDWDGGGNHPGYALACRLQQYKEQVFLLTRDFAVDWTDNVSERGAKKAKRRQSVSGYRQSLLTLGRWCRVASYLDSAAAHGTGALDAVRAVIEGKPWLPPLPAIS